VGLPFPRCKTIKNLEISGRKGMELPENERRALCGICPAGCWVIVHHDEQGKMASVRADESSPFGIICKLGEHSPEIVYSEHRLLYPQRRKGP
jgi:anaerobic selenocysteine-containing dehydrogenase